MCRITSRGWVFLASRVTKIPVQLRRFRLLTLSSPLPVDLRTPKLPVPVIASAPRFWFELAGRGLRCEARWVWLRRLLALWSDLCRSASAYERDGGACFWDGGEPYYVIVVALWFTGAALPICPIYCSSVV